MSFYYYHCHLIYEEFAMRARAPRWKCHFLCLYFAQIAFVVCFIRLHSFRRSLCSLQFTKKSKEQERNGKRNRESKRLHRALSSVWLIYCQFSVVRVPHHHRRPRRRLCRRLCRAATCFVIIVATIFFIAFIVCISRIRLDWSASVLIYVRQCFTVAAHYVHSVAVWSFYWLCLAKSSGLQHRCSPHLFCRIASVWLDSSRSSTY